MAKLDDFLTEVAVYQTKPGAQRRLMKEHYLVSNEYIDPTVYFKAYVPGGAIRVLPKVSDKGFEDIPYGKESVAIVVGEAHLAHILPELNLKGISTVLQVDTDSTVLDRVQLFQDQLLQTESLEQFTDFAENINYPVASINNALPSYSLFASEKRFRLCRAACQHMRIIHLNMDVLDAHFWSLIRKYSVLVNYLNLSNLFDYWCGHLPATSNMRCAYYNEKAMQQLYNIFYGGYLSDKTLLQYSILLPVYDDQELTVFSCALPIAHILLENLKKKLFDVKGWATFTRDFYSALVLDMLRHVAENSRGKTQIELLKQLYFMPLIRKIIANQYKPRNEPRVIPYWRQKQLKTVLHSYTALTPPKGIKNSKPKEECLQRTKLRCAIL